MVVHHKRRWIITKLYEPSSPKNILLVGRDGFGRFEPKRRVLRMVKKSDLAVSKSGERYYRGRLPKCIFHPRTQAIAYVMDVDQDFKGYLCTQCVNDRGKINVVD